MNIYIYIYIYARTGAYLTDVFLTSITLWLWINGFCQFCIHVNCTRTSRAFTRARVIFKSACIYSVNEWITFDPPFRSLGSKYGRRFDKWMIELLWAKGMTFGRNVTLGRTKQSSVCCDKRFLGNVFNNRMLNSTLIRYVVVRRRCIMWTEVPWVDAKRSDAVY